MSYPLFGPVGAPKTPAQQALLHAGVDKLPEPERRAIWNCTTLTPVSRQLYLKDPYCYDMIMRAARTLATYERAFGGGRWVATEPRRCELDSCDIFFTPKGPRQIFCSRRHSRLHDRLKRRWVES